MNTISKDAEKKNIAHWDEVAPVHLKAYGIESLLEGVSRIDDIQQAELYPITGKELIHLQCHIGTDTVSLSMDGAHVTGVDFSAKSLEIARDLAMRTKQKIEFIQANVLDLKNHISKQYDIVYTSKGVLSWIRDIDLWAANIASLLRAGGIFYIMEIHPMVYMFDDTQKDDLQIKYSYFPTGQPIAFDDEHPDYADQSYIPKNKTYEWTWSLSSIINSLIAQGLQIEFLHEHDRLFYNGLPGMEETQDHWWYLNKYKGMIPLAFSLKARKI